MNIYRWEEVRIEPSGWVNIRKCHFDGADSIEYEERRCPGHGSTANLFDEGVNPITEGQATKEDKESTPETVIIIPDDNAEQDKVHGPVDLRDDLNLGVGAAEGLV